MNVKTEPFISKYSSQLSILVIVVSFLMLLYNDFVNTFFWYDEAYTTAMMKHPMSEIWRITGKDVHPPLYYFMLKMFCEVFGDHRYIMRIFSALGILACFILALYPIKRLLGKEVSFVFILLLATMPVTQYLGVEIRMYSWAMFFVLGSSVFAYEVHNNTKLISFSKMTIFSICAIYTHYYALVAIGVIYFLLWISILKKQEGVVRLALFSTILIIAHSPWIPIFITQLEIASHDSWITVPNAKEMLLFCYYFFSPKEPSHPYMIFSLPVMSVALSIMLILIAILIYFVIKAHYKNADKKILAGDGFVSIAILTLILTFAVTFLLKPISIPRYTNCVLGPLILGISIYLVELYKSKARMVIVLFIVMLSLLSVARFFSEKAYYRMKNDEIVEISRFFDNGNRKPDITVSDLSSYPSLAEMQIMFPEHKYILHSPNDHTDYLPFRLQVTDSIPNISEFFFVQSVDDSTAINKKYKIADRLQTDKYKITLLRK